MCKYARAVESYCKAVFLMLCDWEEFIRAIAWGMKLSLYHVVLVCALYYLPERRSLKSFCVSEVHRDVTCPFHDHEPAQVLDGG